MHGVAAEKRGLMKFSMTFTNQIRAGREERNFKSKQKLKLKTSSKFVIDNIQRHEIIDRGILLTMVKNSKTIFRSKSYISPNIRLGEGEKSSPPTPFFFKKKKNFQILVTQLFNNKTKPTKKKLQNRLQEREQSTPSKAIPPSSCLVHKNSSYTY